MGIDSGTGICVWMRRYLVATVGTERGISFSSMLAMMHRWGERDSGITNGFVRQSRGTGFQVIGVEGKLEAYPAAHVTGTSVLPASCWFAHGQEKTPVATGSVFRAIGGNGCSGVPAVPLRMPTSVQVVLTQLQFYQERDGRQEPPASGGRNFLNGWRSAAGEHGVPYVRLLYWLARL